MSIKTVAVSVLIGMAGVLIMLGVSLVPVLNLAVLLWPVPLVITGARRGVGAAVISLATAGIVMCILTEIHIGMLFFTLHLFLVAGISTGLRRQMDFYENILLSSGGALLSILVTLKLYYLLSGRTFFDTLWQNVRNFTSNSFMDLDRMLGIYHQLGLFKGIENSMQLTELVIGQMQILVPSALLIFSLVFGVLNLLVSRQALKMLRFQVQHVPAFGEWSLPRGMGQFFLLSLLVSYLGSMMSSGSLQVVMLTISSLASFIFTVQGISVLWFFLDAGRVPSPLRVLICILIYIFIHMLLTLNMGLTFLGILDQTINLRKNYRNRFLSA